MMVVSKREFIEIGCFDCPTGDGCVRENVPVINEREDIGLRIDFKRSKQYLLGTPKGWE